MHVRRSQTCSRGMTINVRWACLSCTPRGAETRRARLGSAHYRNTRCIDNRYGIPCMTLTAVDVGADSKTRRLQRHSLSSRRPLLPLHSLATLGSSNPTDPFCMRALVSLCQSQPRRRRRLLGGPIPMGSSTCLGLARSPGHWRGPLASTRCYSAQTKTTPSPTQPSTAIPDRPFSR